MLRASCFLLDVCAELTGRSGALRAWYCGMLNARGDGLCISTRRTRRFGLSTDTRLLLRVPDASLLTERLRDFAVATEAAGPVLAYRRALKPSASR